MKNITYMYLPDGCLRGMHDVIELIIDPWLYRGDNLLIFLVNRSLDDIGY